MFYLPVITVGLCFTYLLLYYLFPYFFQKPMSRLMQRSIMSVIIIGVLSIVSYWISFLIPDVQFSNRFLHAFGGGFLGFLVCFLAVKDNNLKIDRFRFFVFSFLIVIALGVANELMEFILQTYTHFIFSPTSTDTWLDLASNLVGIILAAAIFVPFVSRKRT